MLPWLLRMELERGCVETCLPDVWFVVQGVKVGLHRSVLAARSSYYRSMFLSGMNESRSAVIPLGDCALAVFLAAVRFIYTSRLPPPATEAALVPDLLAHAQMVGLDELGMRCQRRLQEALTPTSAADILDLADVHRAVPLRRAAMAFILANFKRVSSSQSFLRLRANLLREVLFRMARVRNGASAVDLDWASIAAADLGGADGAGGDEEDEEVDGPDAGPRYHRGAFAKVGGGRGSLGGGAGSKRGRSGTPRWSPVEDEADLAMDVMRHDVADRHGDEGDEEDEDDVDATVIHDEVQRPTAGAAALIPSHHSARVARQLPLPSPQLLQQLQQQQQQQQHQHHHQGAVSDGAGVAAAVAAAAAAAAASASALGTPTTSSRGSVRKRARHDHP
jgi:hypothetical protein